MKKYVAYGIGAALVDTEIKVQDADLAVELAHLAGQTGEAVVEVAAHSFEPVHDELEVVDGVRVYDLPPAGSTTMPVRYALEGVGAAFAASAAARSRV